MKKKTGFYISAAHTIAMILIYAGLLLVMFANDPFRISDDSTVKHTGLIISMFGIAAQSLIGFKRYGWSWRQATATMFVLFLVMSLYYRYDWVFAVLGLTAFVVIASKQVGKDVKGFIEYVVMAYREISGNEKK